ncbi:Gfo/Idh/MocA family protein [Verrucomicrobiota bacterium sgz303538]
MSSSADTSTRVGVGLIGLGAIGRLHFDCWQKSPYGRVAAIASRDPKKRAGEWRGQEFNLGDQSAEKVDLTGIATYETPEQMFADPNVRIVDICTPTPQHAPLTIAALKAGKHVVLEKPLALTAAECAEVEKTVRETGKQLMVGHCLRFWPHYVKAHEVITSGEYGRPLYARLERSGGLPRWSAGGWLTNTAQSGGVLDMHIHDIDVALWWFGKPSEVRTSGISRDGLPLILDSNWNYENGPVVSLHGAWDPNGGTFRHAFRLVLERATLAYDLATKPGVLELFRDGALEEIAMPDVSAHQAELDEFAKCVAEGRAFTRFSPEDSTLAVELGLQELQQLESSVG